ncbi:small monomeric GTPase [Entamoeba marina]
MSEGFQVIIIGEGSVGKSALCLQFVREVFSLEYNPTIEDTYNKTIQVDNKSVSFNLIDTAGQEEYVALREQYFLKGDGFILVYSIENKASFVAMGNHKESISAIRPGSDVALVLAGNKCDLEDQRVISKEEGEELAKSFGMSFFETSAAKRINVEELFVEMGRQILKIKGIATEPTPSGKSKSTKKTKQSKESKGEKKGGCIVL